MASPLPTDLIPLDPATGRWKLAWYAFIQSLTTSPVLSYTVAGLPASAKVGTIAFASNGCKSGEAATHGTGVPVYWNTTGSWFCFYNNAAVTA